MNTQTNLRNAEFVRTALAILGREMSVGRYLSFRQLIEKALSSTPTGFYVDYDRAVAVCGVLLRAGSPQIKGERRAMWLDFSRKVANVMQTYPSMSLGRAVEYVMTNLRPDRFYISWDKAERLLRNVVGIRDYAFAY